MKLRRKKKLYAGQKWAAGSRPRRKSAARMVEQHLSMLGLSRRLGGPIEDNRLVWCLFQLTSRVVDSVRFAAPRSREKFLRIKEMRGAPDKNGWIAEFHAVRVPFWYPKRKLDALILLEDALDALHRHRIEQTGELT